MVFPWSGENPLFLDTGQCPTAKNLCFILNQLFFTPGTIVTNFHFPTTRNLLSTLRVFTRNRCRLLTWRGGLLLG